ncbi:MAG: SurA N-terminal domain-containing protein [Alphaproteobacteria bacterium]|nr:SurA N-terminal domain-containing protein [Alphaproteobacteria bacterium]
MALQSIRGVAGTWVAKILFVLLILSFAAWGIGDFIRRGPTIAVAEVAGEDIADAEVRQAVEADMERARRTFGGQLSAEQARMMGIADRAVERLITGRSLDHKARALGLAAGDQLVRQSITEDPSFRGAGGSFDRLVFERVLQQNRLGEGQYVALMRTDLVRGQVTGPVLAGAAAPQVLVDALYAHRAEKRVARYVVIPPTLAPAPAAPDDAAIAEFHQRNSDRFSTPEYRAISYIAITVDAFAATIAINDQQIADEYKARKDELGTPARRRFKQFVVASDADAQAAVAAARDKTGDAAIEAAVKAAKDATIIDLGEQVPADLSRLLGKDAVDAMFAAPIGTVAGPAASALGKHVFVALSGTPAKTPSLDEAKEQLRKDLQRKHAVDSIINLTNSVDDALGGGAKLEDVAQKFGLKLEKVPAIDREGRPPGPADRTPEPVALAVQAQTFLQTSFETEVGQDSLLTETQNGDYFVLRVDAVTPPAVRPIAEVRAKVVEAIMAERRAAALDAMAKDLLGKIQAGASLADVAKPLKLDVKETAPFTRDGRATGEAPPPAIVSRMFEIAVGASERASGAGGAVLATLTEIRPADLKAEAAQVGRQAELLRSAVSDDLLAQLAAAVRADANAKIDQRALQRLFAGSDG